MLDSNETEQSLIEKLLKKVRFKLKKSLEFNNIMFNKMKTAID